MMTIGDKKYMKTPQKQWKRNKNAKTAQIGQNINKWAVFQKGLSVIFKKNQWNYLDIFEKLEV